MDLDQLSRLIGEGGSSGGGGSGGDASFSRPRERVAARAGVSVEVALAEVREAVEGVRGLRVG